jgi:hypothetical protein
MTTDTRKQLRLNLGPATLHAVRTFARAEGRSESAMATRLIAEAVASRRACADLTSDELRKMVAALIAKQSMAAPTLAPE